MAYLDAVLPAVAMLLLIAVLASKASDWLGVPALLLFLALGMFAGSEGPGGIWFDDARFAQGVGVTALAFILFAGGLETPWKEAGGRMARAAGGGGTTAPAGARVRPRRPRGGTAIQPGDTLMVLAGARGLDAVRALVQGRSEAG